MSNYRLISILPVILKIFERDVHGQLLKYLEQNKIFIENKFVYRKKHSTKLGTLHLVDEISKQNDNGNMAGALYIDLSKAFDTLNHAVLLSKMKSCGIKSLTIKWFEDCLFHRTQICKINIVTLSYQV